MQHLTQKNAFNNSVIYQEHSSLVTNGANDQGPLPTYKEFQEIINDYLNNLSPKKRDKALVDHTRYCLIQDVLRHPRNTSISTAQFRFWVKKMFRLQPGSYDLVFHDNKPVAMREQIYDILVRAHKEAHHGGRDKTSAIVRNQFSWIPKELIARFVRQCPTCIVRRNGNQSLHTPASKNTSPQLNYSATMNYLYDMTSGPLLSPHNNNSASIAAPTVMSTPHVLLYKPPSSSSVVGKEGSDPSTFSFTGKKHKKLTPPPNYITANNSPSPPKRPFFGSNGLFESCQQYHEENIQNNNYLFQMNNNEYQLQQPHPSIRNRRKEFLNYSPFTTEISSSYYDVVNNAVKNATTIDGVFSKKEELSANQTNILQHEHS